MAIGTSATVGGKVTAAIENELRDMPSAVAVASDASARTITTVAYNDIPTTSVTTSLTLTRTTLVAVTIAGQWGGGAFATLNNTGLLGFALSGSVTLSPNDIWAIPGAQPGAQITGGSLTYYVVAPAGVLTGTLKARYVTASGMVLRNHSIQLVAIRAA